MGVLGGEVGGEKGGGVLWGGGSQQQLIDVMLLQRAETACRIKDLFRLACRAGGPGIGDILGALVAAAFNRRACFDGVAPRLTSMNGVSLGEFGLLSSIICQLLPKLIVQLASRAQRRDPSSNGFPCKSPIRRPQSQWRSKASGVEAIEDRSAERGRQRATSSWKPRRRIRM